MEDGGQSLWRHRKCLLKIFNLHLSVSAMTNLNPMRTRKALTQGKLKGHVKKIVREERTNCAFQVEEWKLSMTEKIANSVCEGRNSSPIPRHTSHVVQVS